MDNLLRILAEFASELKKRRLYRASAAYAAAAFVLLEAADLILPALGFPEALFPALVILAIAGFPLTLIITWYFDFTREGLQRTPPTESLPATATVLSFFALGMATLIIAGGAYLAFLRTSGSGKDGAQRVIVAPFENRTNDPSFETVGTWIAVRVSNGLSWAEGMSVVPATDAFALLSRFESAPETDQRSTPIQAAAAQAGASLAVTGELHLVNDSLHVVGQVIEPESGEVRWVIGPITEAVAEQGPLAENVRAEVTRVFSEFLAEPTLIRGITGHPPSSGVMQKAVTAHYLLVEGRFPSAIELFDQAYAEDSSFAAALWFNAMAYANMGRLAEADSLARILDRRRAEFPPLERHRIDWLLAELEGDLGGTVAAGRREHEIYPSFNYCRALVRVNQPTNALDCFAELQEVWPRPVKFVWYWYYVTDAYHTLAEHEAELQAALDSREDFPELHFTLGLQARALAALGRIDEIRALIEQSSGMPRSQWGVTPRHIRLTAARELRAHGHPAAARELAEEAVRWYRDQVESPPESLAWKAALMWSLYEARRWEDARALCSVLAAGQPDNLYYAGCAGTLAARLGDQRSAREADARLEQFNRPHLFGIHTLWRARIAAVLGDDDRAISLLRQAFEQGAGFEVSMLPFLRFIHSHAVNDFESLTHKAEFHEFVRPKG